MKASKSEIGRTTPSDDYGRSASRFSVSHMSDAKWRKMLGAIADAELDLRRATWKFIDSETLHDWGIPRRSDLFPDRLADTARCQPVEYKWIEWIHFPRRWNPIVGVGHSVEQDVDGLGRVLEAIGRFQIDLDVLGLRIYGYGL